MTAPQLPSYRSVRPARSPARASATATVRAVEPPGAAECLRCNDLGFTGDDGGADRCWQSLKPLFESGRLTACGCVVGQLWTDFELNPGPGKLRPSTITHS